MQWLAGLAAFVLSPLPTPCAEAPAFTGCVVDAAGQPVPEARVCLITYGYYPALSPTVVEQTKAGPDGRFDCRLPRTLDRGWDVIELCAYAEGHALCWVGPVAAPQNALRLVLPPPCPLRGRVVDADGKPVAGVRPVVTLLNRIAGFDPDLPRPRGDTLYPPRVISDLLTTRSDREGGFELRYLPPGVGLCLATAEDGRAAVEGWQDWPDLYGRGAQLVVAPAATIQGQVLRAGDGSPVRGVAVAASPLGTWTAARFGTARTDARGQYEIPGLPPGCYQVWLQDPPVRLVAPARHVRLAAGQALRGVDLAASEGLEVAGVVADQQTGEPVPGARVSCLGEHQPNTYVIGPAVQTDDQGRFSLRAVPGDTVELSVVGSGPDWPPQLTRREVRVAPDAPPQTVELLVPQARRVSGVVLDPQGQPAPGAGLLVAPPEDSISDQPLCAIADGEGRFGLDLRGPMPNLAIRASHGADVTSEDYWADPRDREPITVSLSRGARPSVTGTIVGAGGEGLPYAQVSMYCPGALDPGEYEHLAPEVAASWRRWRNLCSPGLADSRGRFRLRAVWPGLPYELRATAPGHAAQEVTVPPLAPGEQRDLGPVVLPPAVRCLSGLVTDPAGQPLAGVPISGFVRDAALLTWPCALTDVAGRFTWWDLPRGKVEVNVDAMVCDARQRTVAAEADSVVVRAIPRSEQVLVRHCLTPPVAAEADGVRAELRGLYRFRAMRGDGTAGEYLGLDVHVDGDPALRPERFEVAAEDDHGRGLAPGRVSWWTTGVSLRAFELPLPDATRLAQVVIAPEATRAGVVHTDNLPVGIPMADGTSSDVLWAVGLSDQWIEPAGASSETPHGDPPFLWARVYLTCRPGAPPDLWHTQPMYGGPELHVAATMSCSADGDIYHLPESLLPWEDELRAEAQVACKALRAWLPPDTPPWAVVCYWLQSRGGHGVVELPEFLTTTIASRSTDYGPVLVLEDVPLPADLTAAGGTP